jgi:hypothetical protein
MRLARLVVPLLLGLLALGQAPVARAGVERFAVIVGNNTGRASETPLRYAEADADRIYETLRGVGGFAAENILLLKGERAPALTRALVATNDRVRAAIGRPGQQVMLFVYFSGHADNGAIHLAGTDFELRTLEQLVRSSAAAFRVLVLDACRSGLVTRSKGGTPAPPFLASIEAPLGSEGVVFLTSSASSEDSQESDDIGGSFFTHYLTSALLGAGDSDGDGRVTLEEAYRYAYGWTLAATSRTRAGIQHPTFEYDVRGQGGIVITEPGAHADSRATLVFPPGRDYLVTRAGPGGAVIGEVPAGARARALLLPPGRYFVRGRAGDFLLEGEVAAEVRKVTEVRDEGLRRVDYARLVRKGGGAARSARSWQGGYLFHTPLRNATSLCQGGFLGYAQAFSAFDVGGRVHACRAGFQNGPLTSRNVELAASLLAGVTRDLDRVTLQGGVSAGAALLRQDFQTPGLAPPRMSVAPHFGLHAGLTADLPHGLHLLAESAVRTYLFSVLDPGAAASGLQPSVGFQQLVGVGKFW